MAVGTTVAVETSYETWDLFGELLPKGIEGYRASDGLHFNERGHDRIANGLIARVAAWAFEA